MNDVTLLLKTEENTIRQGSIIIDEHNRFFIYTFVTAFDGLQGMLISLRTGVAHKFNEIAIVQILNDVSITIDGKEDKK